MAHDIRYERASTPRFARHRVSRRAVLFGGAAAAVAAPLPGLAQTAQPLNFNDLYNVFGTGLKLTAKAQALVGKAVSIKGFMAPPLKAESRFFVLTRFPMSVCPFCSSEADWPSDIIVVYLNAPATAMRQALAISVTGRLEAGAHTDPDTGFVSMLRLMEAEWQTV
jgi:hypothetical protein